MGKKIGAFLVGGLVGAAAALLYAPRSGQETRVLVSEKMNAAWGQAQEFGAQAQARGQEVVQGANADYVVVPEKNAVPFADNVPYEQGAMFEPATVAIHGVFQNDYHGGEYVAILGGGTVGMFTMQWTKIFGSKKVVVFDISDERLALAKRLGADEVINTKEEGYMEKAMAITGGKGYGFVFETAGQVPTMHMAFELAANKAHVCFIGTPHENLTFTPKQWENMNRKEFKLTGSWMSYSAPYPGREWDLTAHYFATGQLKFDPGFIYKKIPMSQAQEAFQLFKTPGLVKGKILLSNEED